MLFGLPVFREGRQLAAEVDQVLVALGPVAEEAEFLGDGGLGLGGGGFKRERGVGHNSLYGGAWPADRPRAGRVVSRACATSARPAGVFQHDAFGGQLVADGVGTGEVARLLGGGTRIDQALDAGIVAVIAGGGAEPLCRIGLQQSQRQAGTEQLTLQACLLGRVGGPARIGGDAGHFGQRLRRVEVIIQGGLDRGRDRHDRLDRCQFAQGAVQAVQGAHRLLD